MRIVASLVLVMLAAMAMTCDEHGKSPPDGHSNVCHLEGCPFVDCCAEFGRCFDCHGVTLDAARDGITSDAPGDAARD